MANFVTDLAAALVAALQAAGVSEAERRPAPYMVREDIGEDTKVVVFLRNRTDDDGTRGGFDKLVDLGIAVQRAADPSTNDDTDSCTDVVADLWALFDEGGALHDQAIAGAQLDEAPKHPTGRIYEPKHLQSLRLFTSITSVVYRLQN